ncbi:MAG: SpoIID/LytB domain-containing protein [Planctomycetes bacterium]|nr:SpoIID/LytB domain-containing protein [Planctomycetota bacterium]MBM4078797.1 SpoIID/LytB domain-containing protein [Planctomycetota bacterium]MBM4085233.1 SpoIID/LytB domain-containing protein [Planctomycetota bacterium]
MKTVARSVRALFAAVALAMLPSTGCREKAHRETPEVYKEVKRLISVPTMRVALARSAAEMEVFVDGAYEVLLGGTPVDIGGSMPRTKVRARGDGVQLGARELAADSLVIKAHRDGALGFVLASKPLKFRGEFEIIRQKNDKLTLVNSVDMETYMKDVMPGEMPSGWPAEAIRAQVVAARTYALFQRQTRKDELYHIGIAELAYRGVEGETAQMSKLVDSTRGVVLTYEWHIFPAYYHSTCGGRTENVSHVFGEKSIPPLAGVECGHCRQSKFYTWKREIQKDEIQRKLSHARPEVGKVNAIEAIALGPGSHGAKVAVKHDRGTTTLDGHEFRIAVGPNSVLSTAFQTRSTRGGQSFEFSGRGWGHGVGLCQYGAKGMAESGSKGANILRHYYPGAEVVRIY